MSSGGFFLLALLVFILVMVAWVAWFGAGVALGWVDCKARFPIVAVGVTAWWWVKAVNWSRLHPAAAFYALPLVVGYAGYVMFAVYGWMEGSEE